MVDYVEEADGTTVTVDGNEGTDSTTTQETSGTETDDTETNTETTTPTRSGGEKATNFEEENWGVFLLTGETPKLLCSVKGKRQVNNFLSEYLTKNPDVSRDNIAPRSLGKVVPVQTQQVIRI